jgi:hypothetical protein
LENAIAVRHGKGGTKFVNPLEPNAITAIQAALAQPAQEQWNAALDEAANRIEEIAAFPKTTQDSFAVFIRGLKK